jgi:hypothetical protein
MKTDHDWAPICEEDPAIMCNVCFQCQCCETPTEECPGEWVPSQEDLDTRVFLDQWGGVDRG